MGKKILLADDSITIQKVIELTFSDEDFDVVTVGNGRLAIEKVQEVRPDVVLCDIIMPEKDGYEVCDFIKKTPTLAHIPVLLLTGAFEPFDQDRANRVGCDGYLAKPFEPETLIAKVRDLLNRAAKPAASVPRSGPPPVGEKTAVATAGSPPAAIPFVAPSREPEPFAPRQAGFVTSAPPRPAEPIPFPRAASAPSSAPAPFAAPSHAPPIPEAVPVASFIPDEPFEDLDAGSLSGEETPSGAPAPAPFPPVREELLPMTPEESRSLSAPPEDSTSTVMFSRDALPWNAASAAAPASPPPNVATAPPTVAVIPEPEPVAEAEMAELPVFEEVIEEEVEFTPVPPMAPAMDVLPAVEPPPPPPPMYSAPVYSPPPYTPPPPPVMAPPPPVVAPEPPPPPPPPPVYVAPPPPPPPVVEAPPPPPPAPPVAERASMPVMEPDPEPAPLEEIEDLAPPIAEASFEDVAVNEPAPIPAAAAAELSEAAGVAVPLDMVEKIAQRVVAQISEKVVREIAWEVIPDLAEAMIKAEIERLKGELQRL
jgi:CheY-like chemotaxis protein